MFVFAICPPTPRTHQNRQLPPIHRHLLLLKLYLYPPDPSYFSLSPAASLPFQSFVGAMASARAGFSESAKEHGFGEYDSSSDSSGDMASESQVSRPGNVCSNWKLRCMYRQETAEPLSRRAA